MFQKNLLNKTNMREISLNLLVRVGGFSFQTYVKFPKIARKQTGKIDNSDLNHSVSYNRLFD